jgi:hypothetical protein
MSVRAIFSTRPTALRADIRAVERRIRQRRDYIGVAIRSVASNVRERLISPSTLVAAGLLGAAMHRSQRLRALQVLAILQAANVGLRRLLTATSGTSVTLD